MQRALGDFDAWVSGVRRDQGPTRANTEVVEHHLVNGRPLAKVYPLAYWSRGQIWSYLLDKGIPYNPLLDQGYSSLGCWPCTRATRAGEDERAGRWSGTGKTECGLHTFTSIGTSTPEGDGVSAMLVNLVVAGLVVGFMIGLTGVGSGALMAPVLLLLGIPPATVVGSDLLFGLLTKIVGVGSHIQHRTISWRWVWVMAIGSVPGVLHRHANPRALRRRAEDDPHA